MHVLLDRLDLAQPYHFSKFRDLLQVDIANDRSIPVDRPGTHSSCSFSFRALAAYRGKPAIHQIHVFQYHVAHLLERHVERAGPMSRSEKPLEAPNAMSGRQWLLGIDIARSQDVPPFNSVEQGIEIDNVRATEQDE